MVALYAFQTGQDQRNSVDDYVAAMMEVYRAERDEKKDTNFFTKMAVKGALEKLEELEKSRAEALKRRGTNLDG